MALLKEKINPQTGVVTNYHKIAGTNLRDGRLDCFVESYVSKEFRMNGYNADHYVFDFKISIEEEESMGIRQLAYKKIKEMPEWADAEDC